jgi:hypothetical protein
VPVKPVTQILIDAEINVGDVGLIWMDIEGYEPVACRSMEPLMRAKVPLYLEFTPGFYGEAQAAEFRDYLAGFYGSCLVFSDDRVASFKTRDLPISGAQFDVLFHG